MPYGLDDGAPACLKARFEEKRRNVYARGTNQANAAPPRERILLSRDNDVFQKLRALKTNRTKRCRDGLFLVESVAALKQLLRTKKGAQAVLVEAGRPLSHWAKEALRGLAPETLYEVKPDLFAQLSDKEEASELIAVCRVETRALSSLQVAGDGVVLVIDRPSNPGNLGSILRTANAFGVQALVTTGHGVDLHDPLVIRSSLGAFFATPALYEPSKEALVAWMKEQEQRVPGLRLVGTDSKGALPLAEAKLAPPLILCIGNEATGLSPRMLETVAAVVAIPMRGAVDSLNVACAASIVLYAAMGNRPAALP